MDNRKFFEDLVESVGLMIRRVRKIEGLTLEEVAIQAGLTEGYVGNIERGVVDNPSFRAVSNIANALHTDLVTLLVNAVQEEGISLNQKVQFEDLLDAKGKDKRKYRRALDGLEEKFTDDTISSEKKVQLAEIVIKLVRFCN